MKQISFKILVCLLTVVSFSRAHAQVTSQSSTQAPTSVMFVPHGESKTTVAPPQKSLLSDFDLLWISRYWAAPLSQNNMLTQEASLTYHFNDNWSATLKGEFDQMTATESADRTDFQDTDLKLTYIYVPKTKRIDLDFGVSLLGSLPTSRDSQNQIEYFGTGVGTFFDLSYRKLSLTFYSKFYEYFYQDHFIRSGFEILNKSEPGEGETLFANNTVVRYKMIPNCNSYNDNSITAIYNVVAGLKLRNEVRFESLGFFDDHVMNTLHDRYGLGYTFSPQVSMWFSVDAAKNTNSGGDLFDSKNNMNILSFYFKI